MSDAHHAEIVEVVERPVSISHLARILRAYAPAIVMAMAAIALLYVVVAVAIYVFSPTQRVTTQRFRLDFEGATEARYPNGIKFSSGDITSTPILLKVFQDNHIDRFTTFPHFSRAVFVLEANPDYERLAADYQSRLADPKLSPIDRERIQREWQAKSASLAKNDYSLNWLRTSDTEGVPESVVKKALLDTLSGWARYAAIDQHVLRYRVSVLSPQVIDSADAGGEPVIAIQVLRSKIYKVLQNLDDLGQIPGAELVRSAGGLSLQEIRLRLEEIVRFRLEPLTGRVANSAMVADRAATLRFLESQLAYDQREMKSMQDMADSIRQSFAVYSFDQRGLTSPATTATTTSPREETRTQQPPRGDNVVPQLSEGFLDRLLALTSQSNDVEYRQKLVDDYRHAAQAVIPAQQAVSYDQEVLNLVKTSGGAPAGAQAADVRNEIVATKGEVKQLIGVINEIYGSLSGNLSPSKELYTLTAPPVARTEHSRSLRALLLYGIALLAFSLPVIIVLCLIHARIREEEADEPYASTDVAAIRA
jgi:hypothetical protein